jgi:hypothetical protein
MNKLRYRGVPGEKAVKPCKYYGLRRIGFLLVAPIFHSNAALLDTDIQWTGHLRAL